MLRPKFTSIALMSALPLLLAGCEMQGMKKNSSAVLAVSSQSQSASNGYTAFKNTVYALTSAKCSSCHVGDDSYPFADPDPSYAYQISKTLVNFANVPASALMIGVDDGHCGPDCAGPNTALLQSDIVSWAKAEGIDPGSGPSPTPSATPSPSPSPGSGIAVYQVTVYPIVTANCSGCHNGSQNPNFAVTNLSASYSSAKTVVNFASPSSSLLYIRDKDGHCGQSVCKTDGSAMLSAITQWAAAEPH